MRPHSRQARTRKGGRCRRRVGRNEGAGDRPTEPGRSDLRPGSGEAGRMDGQWRIELLGRLQVARGGGVPIQLPAQKAGALLAYLALTHSVGTRRNRPQPREALIELLWPDTEPAAGRGNLRFVLHSLRRQLELSDPSAEPSSASILIADRSTIRLDPSAFTTDVAEFEAALQAAGRAAGAAGRVAGPAAAVELYRGAVPPAVF